VANNPAQETIEPPYTSFRFEVVLEPNTPLPGVGSPICNAAFSECEGLEMSMEPKTIREGGNNLAQPQRIGPVSYGQITLRRGMTSSLDLWRWFAAAAKPGQDSSASGKIVVLDAGGTPRIAFTLYDCLPVRVRGPSLNAKDGTIAVEELQIVYAQLEIGPPDAGGAGLGIGVSAGFGAGVSASVSVGGGVSVGASARLEL
jgi:phage tail-like protein